MLASTDTSSNNATNKSLDSTSLASTAAAPSVTPITPIASTIHPSHPGLLSVPPRDLPSPRPRCINDDSNSTTAEQATDAPAKLENPEGQDVPEIRLPGPPLTPQNPATINVATTSDAVPVDTAPTDSLPVDTANADPIPVRHSHSDITATQVQSAEQLGRRISEVRQSLNILYTILHRHYAPDANTIPPESDSEEEEDDNEPDQHDDRPATTTKEDFAPSPYQGPPPPPGTWDNTPWGTDWMKRAEPRT